MQLTTLQSVKDWMSIPSTQTASDSKLTNLIEGISAEFVRAIEREDFSPASTYTEVRQGDGSFHLLLRHWPINTVSQVVISGTSVAASPDQVQQGWFIDDNVDLERRWELYLAGLTFIDGAMVSVVYNAGYATPPADVAQAITEWVQDRYNRRTSSGISMQGGDGDKTVYEKPAIPLPVQAVIEKYRRKWPSLSRRDDDRQLKMLRAQRPAIVG